MVPTLRAAGGLKKDLTRARPRFFVRFDPDRDDSRRRQLHEHNEPMEAKSTAVVPAADQSLGSQQSVSALWRQATDVAHVCKEIVKKCVVTIAERRYVRVEGWMAISVAHGCIASIRSVEKVENEGVKAVAEVRRISDQAILATAEGFVGMDEPDWYGGTVTRYVKKRGKEVTLTLPKRADHAIRAMAQTRGISRVLRAGFSHVVVLIDEGLSTIPYEEIAGTEEPEKDDDKPSRPDNIPGAKSEGTGGAAPTETTGGTSSASSNAPGGAGEKKDVNVPRDGELALRDQFRGRKWEAVEIHFGKQKGKVLGELGSKSLGWWIKEWRPQPYGNKGIPEEDLKLRAALDVAEEETANEEGSR